MKPKLTIEKLGVYNFGITFILGIMSFIYITYVADRPYLSEQLNLNSRTALLILFLFYFQIFVNASVLPLLIWHLILRRKSASKRHLNKGLFSAFIIAHLLQSFTTSGFNQSINYCLQFGDQDLLHILFIILTISPYLILNVCWNQLRLVFRAGKFYSLHLLLGFVTALGTALFWF